MEVASEKNISRLLECILIHASYELQHRLQLVQTGGLLVIRADATCVAIKI
jgi:hypothetical protein